MKLNNFLLTFLLLGKILSHKIAVFPFEINQIDFSKNYSPNDIINLLFKVELYTPLQLGLDDQKYFGIISLEDHHPMLLAQNCEKMKLFQKNKNIIKKGYMTSNSKTSKIMGDGKDYLNSIKFVEYYSEKFSFFNTTFNENNELVFSEIVFVKDNDTKYKNSEMCLSLGLSEHYRTYSKYEPPHFLDNLYNSRNISTRDWTIKFTDNNKGLLIIGNLPHIYENNTKKYSESNYTKSNSKSTVTFFRPWSISMKEIYFYNSNDDKILINHLDNKFTIAHDFGFIIGSNNYKNLINEYYFKNLTDEKICSLESSEKTFYNRTNIYIDTDGSYSIFVCNKEKMKNHIKNFPILYFSHLDYDYVFELTYKELFISINKYYYFMIIFPNNQTGSNIIEDWHLGIPFLKQYQFIMNFDSKTIGFYRTKNFDDNGEKGYYKNDGKKSKVWIYIWQILLVIILIINSFYIGIYIKRQRKKRANELKDDEYEYVEEGKGNKNNLLN